jgi:hypothetical protein
MLPIGAPFGSPRREDEEGNDRVHGDQSPAGSAAHSLGRGFIAVNAAVHTAAGSASVLGGDAAKDAVSVHGRL